MFVFAIRSDRASRPASQADPSNRVTRVLRLTSVAPLSLWLSVRSVISVDRRRILAPMNDRIRGLAQTLWDYHHVNHQLARADAILVLCSHDKTVAKRGAALFLEGWAPLLIFAGELGRSRGICGRSRKPISSLRLPPSMGVPKERILVENRSTNTGEKSSSSRGSLLAAIAANSLASARPEMPGDRPSRPAKISSGAQPSRNSAAPRFATVLSDGTERGSHRPGPADG